MRQSKRSAKFHGRSVILDACEFVGLVHLKWRAEEDNQGPVAKSGSM